MRISSLDFFDGSRRVVAVDGRLPVLNGGRLSDAHPASVRVFFTNADSQQVEWTGRRIVTVRHGMGCYPFVQVYDSSMSLVRPIEKVVDGGTVMLDFAEDVEIDDGSPWCCVVSYGSEYSEAGGVQDDVAASAAMAAANMTAAQNARDGAVSERDGAGVYAGLASQALSELEGVVGSLSLPSVSAAMVYATLGQCTVDAVAGVGHVRWTDPSPYSVEYGKVWTWKSTVVVSNPDHAPTSVSDGTVVVESGDWNAHSSTPVEVPLQDGQAYVRLFTRMYDGRVSEAQMSPSRRLVALDISDLSDYMRELRSGNVENLSAMYPVGSTIPFVSNSEAPGTSFIVAQYDYLGASETIEKFLVDSSSHHNVILVANTVLSEANGSVRLIPYDLAEAFSLPSEDDEFKWKTYYVDEECTTAYDKGQAQEGDTPASLGLYEKGDVDAEGMSNSEFYKSFAIQYFSKDAAAGEWYVPFGRFEPSTSEFADMNPTFLHGFGEGVKQYLHECIPCYRNKYGTMSMPRMKCFIPSVPMLARTNDRDYRAGESIEYFRRMTSNAQRVQRDVNGSARYVFTGDVGSTYSIVRNLDMKGAFVETANLETFSYTGMLVFLCLA